MDMTDGPRQALARFHQAMLDSSPDGLADLHAVDAVYEFPFLNPARPARYEGREQIRAGFREAWGTFTGRPVLSIHDVVVHETTDAEVIIAEQQFDVVLASTGRGFTSSFLLVLRVRDGLIVHTRDYADTLRTALGTGRLSALLASLDKPATL
jgi:ketosteroid isomerase-like protein